jgi:membrane protease YdiL (CAAX protease family)
MGRIEHQPEGTMIASTLGRNAARFHLLLVLAVALTGAAVLLMVGALTLGGDEYQRGLALLGLVLTAPLWLPGLIATIEVVSVLRGRRVNRRRALAWALAAIAGGALLAMVGGQATLAATLITRPDLVGLDGPALTLTTADGSGSHYYYPLQPTFWLGTASFASVVLDGRERKQRSAILAGAARQPATAGLSGSDEVPSEHGQ